jgi:hypothetical protein
MASVEALRAELLAEAVEASGGLRIEGERDLAPPGARFD